MNTARTQNTFHIETCTQNVVLNSTIDRLVNYCNNHLNNFDFFFFNYVHSRRQIVLMSCALCPPGVYINNK